MATIAVHLGDDPEIERFLAERIYEYNAAATGYNDAEPFTAVQKDAAGAVKAGISGYTWGACCFVSCLWVSKSLRRKGLGSELLAAVERHAREKRCRLVLVATHSFQAPQFYACRGYERLAHVNDHPSGHSSIFCAKRLTR
jgi:N-acetylglutamate synthase-like GNAT family acetyltransferase